jgi:hypothetical protein
VTASVGVRASREHVVVKRETLRYHGFSDQVGDRSQVMRLGVDMAFIAVGALGLLEPIFCVKVLSL